MKVEITVSKSELLFKLKAVSKVINSSNKVVPAHANFMFEIGSEVKVTGADESGNITATIDCRFNEPESTFSFLAETKTMLDGLRELPEQPLTIEINSENNWFTIFHQSGKYKIQSHNTEGFSLAKIDATVSKLITINSLDFMKGIKMVSPFAGNDELRPIMMTVFIESRKGNLSFCATDASTMALLDLWPDATVDSFEFNDFEVALPVKIARIVADLMARDQKIELEITDKNVAIYFGEYRIVYRLIEGRYFNYRSIIPNASVNNKILSANTSEVVSSLRRASVFANKTSSLVELNITGDKLRITGRDNDMDQLADETLAASFNQSEPFTIGFGCNLLLKCLEAVETEDLRMSFSEPTRACLIRPDDVNIGQTLLIMPLLINV